MKQKKENKRTCEDSKNKNKNEIRNQKEPLKLGFS